MKHKRLYDVRKSNQEIIDSIYQKSPIEIRSILKKQTLPVRQAGTSSPNLSMKRLNGRVPFHWRRDISAWTQS
jgi:hypothetical protein